MSANKEDENKDQDFTKTPELTAQSPKISTFVKKLIKASKYRLNKIQAAQLNPSSSESKVTRMTKSPEKSPKLVFDSESVVKPSTSGISTGGKFPKSEASYKGTPKIPKVKNVRKGKIASVKATSKSTIRNRPKVKGSKSPVKKQRLSKALFQRSESSSPIPGPSNEQVEDESKSKNIVISPEDFEYSLNAYKHSPIYMDLKKKRFNTSFKHEIPRGERNIQIYTPEEEKSRRWNDNVPDIPNRMQVSVPGEKYVDIFKNMPIDNYDKYFNVTEEQKLFEQLRKKKTPVRKQRIGRKGVPVNNSPSPANAARRKTKNNNRGMKKSDSKLNSANTNTRVKKIGSPVRKQAKSKPTAKAHTTKKIPATRNKKNKVNVPFLSSDDDTFEVTSEVVYYCETVTVTKMVSFQHCCQRTESKVENIPFITGDSGPEDIKRKATKLVSEVKSNSDPIQVVQFGEGDHIPLLPHEIPLNNLVLRIIIPRVSFETENS